MLKYILILFTFNAYFSAIATAQEKASLEISDCFEILELNEGEFEQLCGYLVVPEEYASDKASQTIKIPFIVFEPKILDESASPVLVTGGGGPGNAILKKYSKYGFNQESFADYFTFSVENNRQLIIFENRGVGHSVPALNCPEIEDWTIESYKISLNDLNTAYFKLASECIDHISASGIDIKQYQVENAANDIDTLRELLISSEVIASEKINLYGISYGARVSLYYEMLYPDKVRTIILDSTSVHTTDALMSDLQNEQNAFNLLFENCRSDKVCRASFGQDLEHDFYNYLDRIYNNPGSVDVTHPNTLKSEQLPLDAVVFLELVHSSMYSNYSYSNLPYTIRTAINGSNNEISNLYTERLNTELNASIDDAAFFSYLCFDNSYNLSEQFVNINNEQDNFPLYKYYSKFYDFNIMEKVCSMLKMTSVKAHLTSERKINTPILLLSGELDPVTPPADALAVKERSENASLVEFGNQSHDLVSSSYCAGLVTSTFLQHPLKNANDFKNACYAPDVELEFFTY